MPKIKVDTNRLNDLSTKTRNIKNKTNECQASVGTVINRLDWEVSSKASINTRLNKVQKRLQRQTELMDAYIRALGTTNDTFCSKDRKLKQDAKNIIYEMNSISANMARLADMKHKTPYKTQDKLNKLFSINNLFGITYPYFPSVGLLSLLKLPIMKTPLVNNFGKGISKDITMGMPTDTPFDILKDARSVIGGIDDISDLTGVFFDEETVDKYLGWAGDLKKTKFFEAVGYAKDTEKLINAINDADMEKVGELGEKYLKKGAKWVGKTTYGVKGFTSAGYINLGWNFVENILEIDKFASATSSNSQLVGFGKYAWNCTGGVMLETGSEMAYDIVKDVGKLFNYDLDMVYKDLTGEDGVEGFYKGLSMATDEIFGDYYNGTKSSGILQGTATMVGDSLSWWGDKIAGGIKNIFG